MRRIKSRNFILVICGVFIMLILGFTVASSAMRAVVELSGEDREKEILSNILYSSSKVELSGRGNFLESNPRVSGTIVTDFNVKLNELGDKVKYSIKFCNINDVDVLFETLWEGEAVCADTLGNDKICDNVKVDGYILSGKQELRENELIRAGSCVDFVLEAEYIGVNTSETIVSCGDFELQLKAIDK